VTSDELAQVMPRCPVLRLHLLAPFLTAACDEFEVNTPKRKAAFVAQLAHESAQFRHFEELADGSEYEGRQDLGNILPGDGKRFKGRGPIQLTGRSNYLAASKALGLDLVNNPKRASDADVGFRVAGWFWVSRKLNELADTGDFDRITRRINGGLNGKAQRDAFYAKALGVFGQTSDSTS
jgi:predicted chitinase